MSTSPPSPLSPAEPQIAGSPDRRIAGLPEDETFPTPHSPFPIPHLERTRPRRRAGVLVGPTAVGKSDVAQWLAEKLGVPILSADSMLVYRGMDVGTAKPTPTERGSVSYFGIDCVAAGASFSTGAWLAFVRRQLARAQLENGTRKAEGGRTRTIAPGERVPTSPVANLPIPASCPMGFESASVRPELIVAGGTGLYVRALLGGLDAPAANEGTRAKWTALHETGGLAALWEALASRPDARALLADGDLQNPRRLIRALERADAGETPADHLRPIPERPVAGLRMARDQLAARIGRRIAKMFDAGLVEEAVALRNAPGGLSPTAAGAIGYAEALAVADGVMTRAEAAERIAARTRQLAKRQFTWFRHQLKVEWIDIADGDGPATIGPKVMEVWKRHGCFEI